MLILIAFLLILIVVLLILIADLLFLFAAHFLFAEKIGTSKKESASFFKLIH